MADQRSGSCWRCGAPVTAVERIGRRETCAACGTDLHCCCNCRFHDPTLHNACNEPQAERQVDKEAGNFCEYFSLAPSRGGAAAAPRAARDQLEALFRRKP